MGYLILESEWDRNYEGTSYKGLFVRIDFEPLALNGIISPFYGLASQ